jgi:hypothetical protein
MRAFSIATQVAHARASTATIAPVGKVCSIGKRSGAPSSLCQSNDIIIGRLSNDPHLVRRMALTIPPTPAGTKTAAKIMPVATTLHLTHEERASPRIDRNAIQITDPARRPPAMWKFVKNQG